MQKSKFIRFMHLLLGFIQLQKGKIQISNVPIQEIALNDLRENISLASQDAYLFHMSIYDNIKFGNPRELLDYLYQSPIIKFKMFGSDLCTT